MPGAAHAWRALGGDPALLDRVSCTPRAVLPARLPVLALARATVSVCSLAAAELSSVRSEGAGGGPAPVPAVHVDDGAVAAAFTSERHLRTDGRAPVTFSALSRFWRTRDGWLRTHANYPHHRARLLAALGISAENGEHRDDLDDLDAPGTRRDPAPRTAPDARDARDERDERDERDDAMLAEMLAAELAGRDAVEVEETVLAAGGLAVAVRTSAEWAEHPQGVRVSERPLLTTVRMDQTPLRTLPEPAGPGPLHGVRVLDLTRVLAGPVATRALALFGADVLRIDSPQLRENADTHADTGMGKRSALLDLASRAGQSAFEELLSAADVVVTGYRPGALDRFGLAPESLADRRPGVIVGQLSAWGAYGPWHRRRGFDSLVQAATGISLLEGQRDEEGEEIPGALPAQALDHGTGYLLAAAVMRALTEQRRGRCGSRLVRVALAQTADWLMNGLTSQAQHAPSASTSAPGTTPGEEPGGDQSRRQDLADPAAWLAEADSPLGRMRYVLPPVGYEGSPSDWSRPTVPAGTDPAAWW
ncbi:CoA transferase [Streptomyces marispadix]|uniref:CoA transferase n=1 Tax=Streptomyces marispadix TaxID=2922868 RepID=A0ABS9T4W1_9ACTN|nr:CoA transferase [Streptomyces marispadix]MCH6163569.1 CoA transferase [Streptomyces marispadix]